MKWAAISLVVLGCLVIIGTGLYLFFGRGAAPVSNQGTEQQGVNPFGFATGGTTGGSSGEDVAPPLTVAGVDGTSYTVPDFTKEDQPAWASASAGYQVAGNEDGDYLITYIPADNLGNPPQFLMLIQAEPIGTVRKTAEQALKNRLGLPDAQICNLDTQVWVNPGTNDTYAGRDLGISFCPGSIKLP